MPGGQELLESRLSILAALMKNVPPQARVESFLRRMRMKIRRTLWPLLLS
jgi:hypothetical protein